MKVNISRILTNLINFISINGLYFITSVFVALNLDIESRFYTVPIRIFVTVSMILVVILKRFKPCQDNFIYLVSIFFFIIYWFKIILEMFLGDISIHIPPYEYLLYSISYAFFPFLYFSQRKSEAAFERILRAILISGILFSIVTIFLFFRITFETGKFNRYLIGMDPLTISYVGSLLIGISFSILVFNKSHKEKKMLIAGILFGIGPFLIGGSRGPVLALIIPFLLVILFNARTKVSRQSIRYTLMLLIILTLAIGIFGSIAFERLNNIFNDIASKSQDVRRLSIWETAFNQFLNSPVWGDSIQIKGVDYPHNLILEVLMSTGIIGFIPFICILGLGIYRSFLILKYSQYGVWIFVFFHQSVVMSMLSGNVYSNIWYWVSLALIFAVDLEAESSIPLEYKPVPVE